MVAGTQSMESANAARTGKPKAASRCAGIVVTTDLCKGCGLCIDVCPPKVLYLSDDLNLLGYQPARYSGENCTGCGICFYACPEPGALTVYKYN